MNERLLVSYELASTLYALGFEVPSSHYFTYEGKSMAFSGSYIWAIKLQRIVPERCILRPTLLDAHDFLEFKLGSRVLPTQKVAGDFGVEIYNKTGDPGLPFKRESPFTQHFKTFHEAMDWGINYKLKTLL